MNEMIWYSGIPEAPGIYWFDSGLAPEIKSTFILQIGKTENNKFVFADGGMMPLTMIYNKRFCENAKWANVAQATEWFSSEEISRNNINSFENTRGHFRAWVKDKDNNLGLAILKLSFGLYGDVIWVKHPNCASSHGQRFGEGWSISPIHMPLAFPE